MLEDNLERDALEIARSHLLKGMPFAAIANDKRYTTASTIHRRLKRWLAADRFELTDKQASQSAARVLDVDSQLETRLVEGTKLWQARVVRISGVEDACSEKYLGDPNDRDTQIAYRAGDDLHHALGEVAAEFILGRLQRNSRIAVASGRGVGFTIMKLAELAQRMPARFRGFDSVDLFSLCGGTRVGAWVVSTSRDLDADENVFSLAGILKVPGNQVTYMGGWISKQPSLTPSTAQFQRNLDLALVGLGQLNTHHHFFRHYAEAQLGAMAEPLRRIKVFQSETPALLYKIAEIGHRPFLVGERDGVPEDFLSAIATINAVVWAMPPEKIREAREVILVAGGAQKVDALFELVTGRCDESPVQPNKVALITDAWTAEAILQRLRS